MSKNNTHKITSFDVAKHAGVSRSAVSRAFTPGANISEKTRKKVIAAAQELGYQVNYLARDLKNHHSHFVCVLANRLHTPYRSKQLSILTEYLLNAGFRPIILNTDSPKCQHMFSDLFGYRVSGFIVTSDTPPVHVVDKCHQFNIPVIFINRSYEKQGVDRIELDFNTCGQTAFDMLNPTSQHHLAVIEVQEHSYSICGRIEAFKNICQRHRVTVHSFYAHTSQYIMGFDIAAEMARFIKHTPLHGVFVPTDLLALGIYDGLKKQGVKIPQHIQIVGFDDIEQASWHAYRLSTIKQDVAWQMQQVVHTLTQRLQDKDTPYVTIRQKIVPVHRGTTLDI